MYSDRQVSRLIGFAIRSVLAPFPAIASGISAELPKYGDEIAQDYHLLPFSPAGAK